MLSVEELLARAGVQKATFSTTDFGGASQAPLSIEQVTQFIELMAAEQVMLPDVRTVTSGAAKWQESILDFSARIARPGTQGSRLADADRVKPGTGIVELSTSLIRGEVLVTDEVFEDNTSRQNLAAALERTIASRFGYDVEDLFLNGDTTSGDTYLALLNGWLRQAQTSGNAVNATSYGQDYQELFRVMLSTMPHRHLRNLETDGRFYVPKRLEQKYRDLLAQRGTALGDFMLTGKGDLTYQGIKIVGVPAITIVSGTPDTSKVLLSNRNNLYAGYHRTIRFETDRQPREGNTSFLVSARVDAKVAVPGATVLAHTVDVE